MEITETVEHTVTLDTGPFLGGMDRILNSLPSRTSPSDAP